MMTVPLRSPVAEMSDRRPHAVVVGAGFGGLAAAVRLGAKGYRVTVCERLDRPGGRARVFEQDGFRFDAGPTIVTAPFLFEELWTLCGKRMADHVTLKPMDPGYTLRFADGSQLAFASGREAMRAEVARFSPGDLAGYDRFLAEARACFETGFEGMVDKPFHNLASMLRALPALIARRADRSIYALACKHVRDERLRMALSFHPLFVGGNPMRTSAILSLITHLEQEWGVHWAMGGTGAIVRGMCELIAAQGGRVRTGSEVARINVEEGRVRGVALTGGETIAARIVVSDADAAFTYSNLVEARHNRRWTRRRLERAAYSMGLFVWYFGTDIQYPQVGHHTIAMGPRYRGLLRDIFDRKILADDFSLYLHRPTASDPSLAPPRHDAFYVLSPVPNLDGSIDWRSAAEPYRRKIEAFLEANLLPGLGKAVVTSRIMTPLDFEADYRSLKGAAFSFEPRLTQTAWFRPHNASEDIAGLYIVGAGTHPGAGMPGVLASARILDRIVPHAAQAATVAHAAHVN